MSLRPRLTRRGCHRRADVPIGIRRSSPCGEAAGALAVLAFVIYAALIFLFVGLHRNERRFNSVTDLTNIVRASTILAVAPNALGEFFVGKITVAVLADPDVSARWREGGLLVLPLSSGLASLT
jgi:hypothetical protein